MSGTALSLIDAVYTCTMSGTVFNPFNSMTLMIGDQWEMYCFEMKMLWRPVGLSCLTVYCQTVAAVCSSRTRLHRTTCFDISMHSLFESFSIIFFWHSFNGERKKNRICDCMLDHRANPKFNRIFRSGILCLSELCLHHDSSHLSISAVNVSHF